MSCPRASAAFATSAFSPTLAASRSSPGYAPCWPFPNPSGPPSPRITANAAHSSPATASTFALSAAAEWSTSAHGRIALRHGRPHAATPHDAQPANHASVSDPDPHAAGPCPLPAKLAAFPSPTSLSPNAPEKNRRQVAQLGDRDPPSLAVEANRDAFVSPEKRVPHSPPRPTPIGG